MGKTALNLVTGAKTGPATDPGASAPSPAWRRPSAGDREVTTWRPFTALAAALDPEFGGCEDSRVDQEGWEVPVPFGPRGSPSGAARDVVALRVPAVGAYLSVLRTTTAGLAARWNFTLDEMEDLQIAVDEACAALLPTAVPGADLERRVRAHG